MEHFMKLIQETPLKTNADTRGSLVAIEGQVDVAFDIKRVFYIFGSKGNVRRGCHAHYRLTEMAVCVTGSCRFVLDNGWERAEHVLNSKTAGLLLPPLLWREMYDFSPDCVLLVLADGPYDHTDYITDYDQFYHFVHAKGGLAHPLVA